MILILAIALSALAFLLSASAGLGGSLILVPTLSLLLGPKQGIALAALLLAVNNLAKVWVYRHTIPLAKVSLLLGLVIAGSLLGALALLSASESTVGYAIVAAIAMSAVVELVQLKKIRKSLVWILTFFSGSLSGFSGTSGPLKGLALRQLGLSRMHFVGAASVLSLAGDAVKATVYTKASLLNENSIYILLWAVPVCAAASYMGRRVNKSVGEKGYTALFWAVMAGYTIRLVF